jgi:hypothetical protein
MQFLDGSLFIAKQTGWQLKIENVISGYCEGGSEGLSCSSVPPIISASVMEAITDTAEPLIETIERITQGNMIVTILLGATASELFSALRQFQFFAAVSMI